MATRWREEQSEEAWVGCIRSPQSWGAVGEATSHDVRYREQSRRPDDDGRDALRSGKQAAAGTKRIAIIRSARFAAGWEAP